MYDNITENMELVGSVAINKNFTLDLRSLSILNNMKEKKRRSMSEMLRLFIFYFAEHPEILDKILDGE